MKHCSVFDGSKSNRKSNGVTITFKNIAQKPPCWYHGTCKEVFEFMEMSKEFLWGGATAANQYEGAYQADS